MNTIIDNFECKGKILSIEKYGSGHINDTFLLKLRKNDETEARVILQRMNKSIFTKPVELMESVINVLYKAGRQDN